MIHRILATGLTLAGFASAVLASDGRNPGSLLLYPEFDNRAGVVTVVTVTNVDVDEQSDPIDAHFFYIGKYDDEGTQIECLEFNRTETLTPADTITLITNFHNPNHEQGYLYVVAENVTTGNPIKHNYLVGNVMTVDGLEVFEYSVNPVSYLGMTDNATTDLDGDGLRDLDNMEYSANPEEILIPRFLGQGQAYFSELILIGLTGGTAFATTVDFLIFNDNEEMFSSEYTFTCWDRVPLADISFIFENDFLRDWTLHDPAELLGAPHVETGWIHLKGAIANSSNSSIDDPAIYAVLVEHVGQAGAADLPFEQGMRTNGELLSHDINGLRRVR